MMRTLPVWIVVAAACGGGGSNDPATDASDNADAKVFMDAPPVVPMTIMIGGKTTETGLGGESVVANVAMAAFASSNDTTPLAMATSDAQGNYTLTVMTNGTPLDGFLKATKAGYVDLYMYPTGPFTASTMDAGVNMMSPSNKDYLNSLAGGGQMAGKGLIGLQVRDAAGNPVSGATISSTPASTYRYNNSSGLPSSNATSTSNDGVAFMFNVGSGPITISASKSGMTFKSHVVVARADKFTTTSITQ